jgi:hypothetical protein
MPSNFTCRNRHISPEGNITLVYDFTYDGGGLYKRGTGTLSITRRHVRARDDLLRTEPQNNELETLRLRKMKTLSGLWHESSSKRFLKRIKYDRANLFDGPVLMRMREFVDF